jgi:hypothetical protein
VEGAPRRGGWTTSLDLREEVDGARLEGVVGGGADWRGKRKGKRGGGGELTWRPVQRCRSLRGPDLQLAHGGLGRKENGKEGRWRQRMGKRSVGACEIATDDLSYFHSTFNFFHCTMISIETMVGKDDFD